MLEQVEQEGIVELERGDELVGHLPDAVEEEQERGRHALAPVAGQRRRVYRVTVARRERVARLQPLPLHQRLEPAETQVRSGQVRSGQVSHSRSTSAWNLPRPRSGQVRSGQVSHSRFTSAWNLPRPRSGQVRSGQPLPIHQSPASGIRCQQITRYL